MGIISAISSYPTSTFSLKYLVFFKDSFEFSESNLQKIISGTNIKIIAKLKHLNAIAIQSKSISDIKVLKKIAVISKVIKNQFVQTSNNDSAIANMSILDLKNWGQQIINLQKAHKITQGEGVKILLIDTGIDKDHDEIKASFLEGENFIYNDAEEYPKLPYNYFDQQAHGTHIAGILTGSGKIQGVAPKAKLYVAKACKNRTCNIIDVTTAIHWGIEKQVDIINMSLGWPDATRAGDITYKNLLKKGIIVIASSGNNGQEEEPSKRKPYFPCSYNEVICVGASDSLNRISAITPISHEIDILAPGEDIYSTMPHAMGVKSTLNVEGLGIIPNRALEGLAIKSVDAEAVFAAYGGQREISHFDVNNKIVITLRGKVKFEAMADAAVQKGAVGLIIIDYKNDIEDAMVKPHGSKTSIPVVMIAQSSGNALLDLIKARPYTSIKLSVEATDYGYDSGSSIATPFVTGVVALMKSVNSKITFEQIKNILHSTATPVNGIDYDLGIVNAYEAVKVAMENNIL